MHGVQDRKVIQILVRGTESTALYKVEERQPVEMLKYKIQ